MEAAEATLVEPRTSTAELTAGSFVALYLAQPHERISLIRQGVTAKEVAKLSTIMNLPQDALLATLGIARTTVHRKAQRDELLSPDESERLLGIQAMIGQVARMVGPEEINNGFDPARWVAEWLNKPQPAFGGEKPSSYMDTVEGQKMVSNLLAMSAAGVYA